MSPKIGRLPIYGGELTGMYWAKVLTDLKNKLRDLFVVQYFGIIFRTLNENTILYQS